MVLSGLCFASFQLAVALPRHQLASFGYALCLRFDSSVLAQSFGVSVGFLCEYLVAAYHNCIWLAKFITVFLLLCINERFVSHVRICFVFDRMGCARVESAWQSRALVFSILKGMFLQHLMPLVKGQPSRSTRTNVLCRWPTEAVSWRVELMCIAGVSRLGRCWFRTTQLCI